MTSFLRLITCFQSTGRVLRFLATSHIFQEVAPNVFANNRNSLALDTGLPSNTLKTPEDKIGGTGQTAAWCAMYTTDVIQYSPHLADVVLHPSKETQSPFNLWGKTDLNFYQWLGQPENKLQLQQMTFGFGSQNRGFEGTGKCRDRRVNQRARRWAYENIIGGFDWSSMPEGSVIVDVGGGNGFAMKPVLSQFPSFKITVQDTPSTISEAEKVDRPNIAKDDKSR